MKSIRHFFGFALILFSILGLVVSTAGLLAVPKVAGRLRISIEEGLDLTLLALDATDESLVLAGTSIKQAIAALDSVRETTLGIGQTLDETDPLLNSVGDIVGQELPAIVESTQESLASSEASARVIDQVLYSLNTVAAVTGIEYDPETPLAESIADVSDSLDSLPESFEAIEEDMAAAQSNLGFVEQGATSLAGNLADIGVSLSQAQEVIEKYRTVVGRLETNISNLSQRLDASMRAVVWGFSLLLVWLIISQIGLVFQGWEMVGWERKQEPIPAELQNAPAGLSVAESAERKVATNADQAEPEGQPFSEAAAPVRKSRTRAKAPLAPEEPPAELAAESAPVEEMAPSTAQRRTKSGTSTAEERVESDTGSGQAEQDGASSEPETAPAATKRRSRPRKTLPASGTKSLGDGEL